MADDGMPARHPGPAGQADQAGPAPWRKSRYSNPSGNCVEVAPWPAGGVAVRDSKDPASPVLVFGRAEWEAFARKVRGRRDRPAG